MAQNVCATCKDTFTTATGHPPDPPMCDDCKIESIWGVRLDGDVGEDVIQFPPPPPPPKQARRQSKKRRAA